jgi:hypothetical protein
MHTSQKKKKRTQKNHFPHFIMTSRIFNYDNNFGIEDQYWGDDKKSYLIKSPNEQSLILTISLWQQEQEIVDM